MSICPSKSLTPKGGSYHPKKRDPTRYCLGWTFSWSMNACQKSQRSNGPNMKQGFGGQNVKLHPLNHLKFLTFPNLLSWRPAFNEASCCQSRAGAEKRRVFLGVVLLDAVHSCRLCRLQMKRLPRDEVVAQQPMLGFATDQACSIREVQLTRESKHIPLTYATYPRKYGLTKGLIPLTIP